MFPQNLLLLLTLSSFAFCPSAGSSASNAPIVSLKYGSFQGNTSGDVTNFLGIPFADAPVGKLRFARPQAPKKINGVQQATSFGAACFQQSVSLPDVPGVDLPVPDTPIANMSEDCLFVNIVRPSSIPEGQTLPVLFWIYGGGYEIGDTSQYVPTQLVERSIAIGQPVVYVSANYRLNVFGFLSSKEVKDAGVGNLGLVDQRFALQWVQENIKLFGGDPNRVIIWGESAGAISASQQMLINNGDNEGLFHGAFLESGSPQGIPDITAGQPFYDELVSDANCTNANDTLECLREAPLEVILDFVNNSPNLFSYRSINLVWEPSVDGNVIVRNPQDSVAQGLYTKVPVVSGDCDDEGTLFSLSTLNITTDQEFSDYIQSNYLIGATTSQVASVAQAYPDALPSGSPFDTGDANELSPEFKRLAAFLGDWEFQAPRRLFLGTISKTQNTWAFLYRRDKSSFALGSAHTSDIPEFYSFSPDSDFIGTDALVNFAYTLNPSSKNSKSLLAAIEWPRWSSNSSAPPLLTFNDPAPDVNITADNYREEAMNLLIQLWKNLY